jgi:hypothetical protein
MNAMDLRGMPIGMRLEAACFQPPAPAQSSKDEPAPALAIGQERAGGERGW